MGTGAVRSSAVRSSMQTSSRPTLAPHVRLSFDAARNKHVLLSPETVAVLNRTSAEILQLCDGQRSVAEIVAAHELGVLQLHLSGGEPLLRRDVVELAGIARELGLYTNLITSALGLSRRRAEELRAAGLDHVQISIQADEPAMSDRIAGTRSFERKVEACHLVKELGWPLTLNVVLHRQNIDRIGAVLRLAEELG